MLASGLGLPYVADESAMTWLPLMAINRSVEGTVTIRSCIRALVASMSPDIASAMQVNMIKAFPEYEFLSLEEMLEVEVQQSSHARATKPNLLVGAIECMAGKRELSSALEREDFRVLSLDVKYHLSHDVSSAVGLRKLMVGLRFLRVGGLLWMAPTCKSWIWMTRGLTQRSVDNPAGDSSCPMVSLANKLLPTICIASYMAWFSDCVFVIEQPMSSVMNFHADFKSMMDYTGGDKHTVWHGAYGGNTMKPLKLMGTAPWLDRLRRPRPVMPQVVALAVTVGGKTTISKAKRSETSRSEHYCREFGESVALYQREWIDVLCEVD